MDLIKLINYTYNKTNIYYGLIICYDENIIKSIYNILKNDDYPIYIFKINDNMEELKQNYRLFLVYSKHLNNFDYFSDISIVFSIKRNIVYVCSKNILPYYHSFYENFNTKYHTSCFYISI